MNTKAKGTRLERKALKLLESVGYQCLRSAASLGPFDIIALNRLGTRCIQVKANSWPRPDEREALRAVAKQLPPNCCVECWRWDDGKPEPFIRQLDEF